eukprot:gene2266-2989_t
MMSIVGWHQGQYSCMLRILMGFGRVIIDSICSINDMVFVVALQPGGWGLEVIFMRTYNSSDSPWQFLSDLSVEYEKKSKEWKFNVIEAIAKCPKKDFLNEETQL